MIKGIPNIEQLKKEGKRVVAHGFGVNIMMKKCYEGGYNSKNSVLYVRNAGDLDSEFWVIAESPQDFKFFENLGRDCNARSLGCKSPKGLPTNLSVAHTISR